MGVDERGIGAKFRIFFGELVEEQHPAADRVARRVVAANDQKNEIAEELARRHVAGRVPMREHRDKIAARAALTRWFHSP